jgi:hypothetical protein
MPEILAGLIIFHKVRAGVNAEDPTTLQDPTTHLINAENSPNNKLELK